MSDPRRARPARLAMAVAVTALLLAGCGDRDPTHVVAGDRDSSGVRRGGRLPRHLLRPPRPVVDPHGRAGRRAPADRRRARDGHGRAGERRPRVPRVHGHARGSGHGSADHRRVSRPGRRGRDRAAADVARPGWPRGAIPARDRWAGAHRCGGPGRRRGPRCARRGIGLAVELSRPAGRGRRASVHNVLHMPSTTGLVPWISSRPHPRSSWTTTLRGRAPDHIVGSARRGPQGQREPRSHQGSGPRIGPTAVAEITSRRWREGRNEARGGDHINADRVPGEANAARRAQRRRSRGDAEITSRRPERNRSWFLRALPCPPPGGPPGGT